MAAEPGEAVDVEAELALTLELIDVADYAHAAHHLSAVAAEAPHDARLRDAVTRLCEEADEPLELAPLGESTYLGTLVLRGLIEARRGRLDDALQHLLQAECHDPRRGYLAALDMDGASAASLAAVDDTRVGELLASLARAADDLDEPSRTEAWERAMGLCSLLLGPYEGSEALVFAACVLLRRLGEHRAAVELAQELLAERDSYKVAIALANAHRSAGEQEAAAAAYRKALEIDPEDVAAALDLGDMCGDGRNPEQAIQAYELALAREPGQPWAQASLHYYRYLLEDRPEDLEALSRLADAGESERARLLHLRLALFDRCLPARPEALLSFVYEDVVPASIGVSSLEAPSAVSVARLLAPGVVISMGECRGVDPRAPRSDVELLAWRYRLRGIWPVRGPTNESEPVTHGADPAVTARVRALAAEPYDAAAWYTRAKAEAEGLDDHARRACVAAMVSFAPDPTGKHALPDWVFRCQVAAAFILAHLPCGEQALWDLVYGPVDWTSTAAVTALTQRAIAEPERRERIAQQLLEQLLAVDNPIGFMCLSLPAAQNLLRIPDLPAEARELARAVRSRG